MLKNIKVTKIDDETRIDRWLKRHFTSLSQNFIEKNIRKGIIKVNNNKTKANYIVIAGDIINIYGFLEKNYSILKKNHEYKTLPAELLKEFNKSVIYQNSDFFIINKWTGISTQEGKKNQEGQEDQINNDQDIERKNSNNEQEKEKEEIVNEEEIENEKIEEKLKNELNRKNRILKLQQEIMKKNQEIKGLEN